jgi:HD-GYP domain-containing protein (c-di-GMP phosphodiesterase class II)
MRLSWIGLYILPSFLCFALLFIKAKVKKTILLTFLNYGLSTALFLLALFTPYITKEVYLEYPHIVSIPGSLSYLNRYYIFIIIIWVIYYFLKDYQKSYFEERVRIRYFLLGIMIYALGGIIFAFLLPTVRGMNYSADISCFFSLPWLFLTIYSISRYHLIGLRFAFKKISLITFGGALGFILIYFSSILMRDYYRIVLAERWYILPIILSAIVGFFYHYFVKLVIALKEEEFSKEKFEYRESLRKGVEKIRNSHNVDEILWKFISGMKNAFNPLYISLFIYQDDLKKYIYKAGTSAKDYNFKKKSYFFKEDSLILSLEKEKEIIDRGNLRYLMDHGNLPYEEKNQKEKLLNALEEMGCFLCLPIFHKNRLFGFILLGERLSKPFTYNKEDLELFTDLISYTEESIKTALLREENLSLVLKSLQALIQSVEAKDPYTGGHSSRVADISNLIGERLEDELEDIPSALVSLRRSALLHDIGKIGIPDNILNKFERLTPNEFEVVKEHPQKGITLINSLKEWLGEDIIKGILQHHENYDGSGYPKGIKGRRIHIFGRIIRVVDTFDALITDRPYRPAFEKKEAIKQIKDFQNIFFDPLVVEKLVNLYEVGKI